jgi:hypothetical protein
METFQLTVRTLDGTWEEDVDSWTSLVVIASLSAEPESITEMAEAMRRYLPEHRLFDKGSQTQKRSAAGAEGAWCLIDLVGRTVVAGAGFELPEPRGAYKADADEHVDEFPIVWLDTPADWLFREEGDDWPMIVEARASARAAMRRVDARAVLFGQPLLEHVANGVLATAEHETDEALENEQTRALHAQWLMTGRADLGGRTPRQVLLAERVRIVCDLEHRSEQWSQQGHAAPALPRESTAYRFAGFGTIEVVFYFDLVRALLDRAWELASQDVQSTPPAMVDQLAEFRDSWLSEPNEETSMSMTPAEMIELERRRMPIASDGSHLHCDCPICQAEAEGAFGSGPSFLCFDGHHLELEEEFAFSLIETREEWEREQEEYRKYSDEIDRKERERAAAGTDNSDPFADSVWKASYVNWEAVGGLEAGPRQALLALGFPLAELTNDLKDRPDGTDLLRLLNAAYGHFRASQDSVATESTAEEFREALETVSRKFPDLTAKCADLQSRLDEVGRRR